MSTSTSSLQCSSPIGLFATPNLQTFKPPKAKINIHKSSKISLNFYQYLFRHPLKMSNLNPGGLSDFHHVASSSKNNTKYITGVSVDAIASGHQCDRAIGVATSPATAPCFNTGTFSRTNYLRGSSNAANLKRHARSANLASVNKSRPISQYTPQVCNASTTTNFGLPSFSFNTSANLMSSTVTGQCRGCIGREIDSQVSIQAMAKSHAAEIESYIAQIEYYKKVQTLDSDNLSRATKDLARVTAEFDTFKSCLPAEDIQKTEQTQKERETHAITSRKLDEANRQLAVMTLKFRQFKSLHQSCEKPGTVRELRDIISSTKSNLYKVQGQLFDANLTIEVQKYNYARRNSAFGQEKAQKEQLVDRLEKMQREQEDYPTLSSDYDALKIENTNLRNRTNQLENNLQYAHDLLDEKSDNLEQQQEDYDADLRTASELRGENATLEATCVELKTEVECLEGDLQKERKKCNAFEKALQSERSKYKALMDRVRAITEGMKDPASNSLEEDIAALQVSESRSGASSQDGTVSSNTGSAKTQMQNSLKEAYCENYMGAPGESEILGKIVAISIDTANWREEALCEILKERRDEL